MTVIEEVTDLLNGGHRLVKSISVSGVENNAGTQCNFVIVATCQDGSLWMLRDDETRWTKLPPIPQETS